MSLNKYTQNKYEEPNKPQFHISEVDTCTILTYTCPSINQLLNISYAKRVCN